MSRDASALCTTSTRHSFTSAKRRLERPSGRGKRRGRHNTRRNRNKLSNRERLRGRRNFSSKSRIKLMQSNKRLPKITTRRRMKSLKKRQPRQRIIQQFKITDNITCSHSASIRVCLLLEILSMNKLNLRSQ